MKRIIIYKSLTLASALLLGFLSVAQQKPEMILSNENDIVRAKGIDSDIKDLRTRTAKHYFNSEGSKTAVITSGGSLHYLKNGKWENIDCNIYPNNDNSKLDYEFASTENVFKSYYSSQSMKGIKTEFKEGEITEWLNIEIDWIDANGLVVKNLKSSQSQGKAQGQSMRYFSLFPEISAEITQNTDGRAIDYTIHSSNFLSNAPENATTMIIYETIEFPENWTIGEEKRFFEQTNTEEPIAITIFDQTGKAIIRYGQPIYFEKNINELKPKQILKYYYSYSVEAGQLRIGKLVPMSWLQNPELSYPIVIDPTATVYPSNTSKWSGSIYRKDNNGNLVFIDYDIDLGWYDITWPSSNERSHAYAKFDITSIPDAAQVTNVKLRLTSYQSFFGGGSTIVNFASYGNNSTDPVTRTTNQIYSDLSSSNYVRSYNFNLSAPTTFTLDATGAFNADVESKLVSNWYSMAMWSIYNNSAGGFFDESHYHWFFGANRADAATKPALIIDYCDYYPTATAGGPYSICNTNTVNLSATAPIAGETGQWTIESGCVGCTFSPSASTPNATLNNIPQGSHTLRWTITITDGGCTSSQTATVTNNTPTAANAGIDAITCTGSYQLGGNFPAIGSGTWSVVSGAGTFSPNNTTYNATVSNLNSGANVFRWTITNNSCSTSDDVTITLNSIPAASISTPASTPFAICANNQVLVANNPGANSGQWSLISGSGVFDSETNFSTNITGLAQGNNIVRWTVTAPGVGCVNQSNVTIVNNLPTSANAGPDISTSTEIATMQANSPTVGTGTWSCINNCAALTINNLNSANTTIQPMSLVYPERTLRWCIEYAAGGCPSSCDDVVVYYDPDEVGLILSGHLDNRGGNFTHTNDPNYFIMTGSAYVGFADIKGEDGTYIDAKIRVKGAITYKGSIAVGKFSDTWVQGGASLTIDENKIYKNHTFLNGGTLTMTLVSFMENSGNWTNTNTFNHGTGNIIFNGAELQTINSGGSQFYDVTIDNSDVGIILASEAIVSNKLIMTSGNITTVDNNIITIGVGSAPGQTGSLDYTEGHVIGKMKRWFAASTNTGESSGLFPLGANDNDRFATVEYDGAPSIGGTLTAQWISVAMGDNGLPLIINTVGSCPEFELDKTADEGYWQIDDDGITAGTYAITLIAEGLSDFNSLCELTALKRVGASPWVQSGNHALTTGNMSRPIVKRTGASGWSNWGVGGTPFDPLPVELLSFEAKCDDNNAAISWSTASESNNDYFIIEHSEDLNNFKEIAFIDGKGFSNNIVNYSFTDKELSPGTNYYRLKQVDFDGKTETFNIVMANCDKEKSKANVITYPNPFKSEVYIYFENLQEQNLIIEIYDELGKVVNSYKTFLNYSSEQQLMDLSDLKPAVYYLKVISQNEVFNIKMIKQ